MFKQKSTFDHRLSTTLLISILYPLGPAALILMPMIVGGLIDTYGMSEQQVGNIAALEGMGIVVASIIASFWIRKVSWTKTLVVSMLFTALFNYISAHISDYSVLLAVRFLTGISAGTVFAITVAALGDNKEPDRAFGIAQAVQGVMMFAAFAAAPMVMEGWAVSGLYNMLAAVFVFMMVFVTWFPSSGIDHASLEEHSESVKGATALIWLGLLASVIFFINVFGLWTFIERIGLVAELPNSTIGLALGAAQLIAVGGALLAAVVSDRYGRVLPLLVVLVGQCLVLWLLIGKFSSLTFFVAVGAFQALFMIGVSYQMGAIAKVDVKGKYLVLMTAAQGLGAAFGPGIAASLIKDNDYSGVNTMAAVCCLISILMFFFIIYRSRKLSVASV